MDHLPRLPLSIGGHPEYRPSSLTRTFATFLALLLVAGCALVAGPTGQPDLLGHATLSLNPDVQDGGYRSQALASAYVRSDINHVQIRLFKRVNDADQAILGVGGVPIVLDLPAASLSVPILFTNLAFATTYRVRAYAFADAGTAQLISDSTTGSYVDVVVGTSDRPTLANLPVRLLGAVFGATATTSAVVVTGGGMGHPGDVDIGLAILPKAVVTTVAGSPGVVEYTDGTASQARFNRPHGVVCVGTGSLYVADSDRTVRKIDLTSGLVTTPVGTASFFGYADGTGSAARFNTPNGIVTDGSGSLYVSDDTNSNIRKIVMSTGAVTTIAGSTLGQNGSTNGTGTSAKFNAPRGLALDGAGNLFVADSTNNLIRKIVLATGVVTTLAGTVGVYGSTDGIGTAARLRNPCGLAADGSGNLYVADSGNFTLRKIVISTGEVTTLAGQAGEHGAQDGFGTSARFGNPYGLAYDGQGTLYLADGGNCLRKIVLATRLVTTIAGLPGHSGAVDDAGSNARFDTPYGIAFDGFGNLYVTDSYNDTIRKVVLP